MSGAPPRLILLVKPFTGEPYSRTIVSDIVIGTDPERGLDLSSPFVSFHHARIEKRPEGFYSLDGEDGRRSMNGTLVERRVAREGQSAETIRIEVPTKKGILLQEQDTIVVADTRIVCWFKTRRWEPKPQPDELFVKPGSRQVFIGGIELVPSPGGQVFDLLELLWEARGNLVSRAEIGQAIWSDPLYPENSVHQIVSELRRRLGPGYIQNKKRKGWRLDPLGRVAASSE